MSKSDQPSPEKSRLHPTWRTTATVIQARLEESQAQFPSNVKNFGDLVQHVRSILLAAIKDGRLKASHYDLPKMVKECDAPAAHLQSELQKVERSRGEDLKILLGGGNSDGARFSEAPELTPHFTLDDGSWLDFSITVRQTKRQLELEGFIFSLTFPDSPKAATGPRFLRLDMNLSNHRNDQDGLRVHLHPGNNDIQVPVPWMSPEEVLKFFLYGLRLPENPQHDQA